MPNNLVKDIGKQKHISPQKVEKVWRKIKDQIEKSHTANSPYAEITNALENKYGYIPKSHNKK